MGSKLKRFSLLFAIAVINGSAFGGVVYDSGGFESPTFSAGNVSGQDSWISVGGGATGVVSTNNPASGTQALEVTRTSGDTRFLPTMPASPSISRFVSVNWDMNVQQSSTAGAPFGPFFGIEAYDPTSLRFGAGGVDASTGDVLYEAPTTGLLTATGATVSFGQYNHFTLLMDTVGNKYSLFVNNKLAVKAGGVVDAGAKGFSDADVSALAATMEPPLQSGKAFFDNYSVTTSATAPGSGSGGATVPVPPVTVPAILTLLVAAGVRFIRRQLARA